MWNLNSNDNNEGPPQQDTPDGRQHPLHSPARSAFSILVVDDEPAKRYGIARALKAAGYRVAEAESAADALRDYPSHSALVLDVYLPDMFGFEVCRRIRATTTTLPIVQVSTVLVEERYQEEGRDAGADAYLADPTIEQLVETLDALLNLGGAAPPLVQ
jgi:CheY-like chemotaxis protein